jgi:hypothetical protein
MPYFLLDRDASLAMTARALDARFRGHDSPSASAIGATFRRRQPTGPEFSTDTSPP